MNIEEYVNDYLQEHRHDVLLNPYNGLVEFAEALKAEALKKAVEWTVTTNLANRPVIYLDQLKGFQYGDKVRIIIIKED